MNLGVLIPVYRGIFYQVPQYIVHGFTVYCTPPPPDVMSQSGDGILSILTKWTVLYISGVYIDVVSIVS